MGDMDAKKTSFGGEGRKESGGSFRGGTRGSASLARGMSSNRMHASNACLEGLNLKTLKEIGSDFWQIRADFKILGGLFNLKTHMGIVRISSGPDEGKFLILSAVKLTPEMKRDLDLLTNDGKKIAAVIGTHPFHTLAFPALYEKYPNAKFYGTPRHLRVLPQIKWEGETMASKGLWAPDLDMKIPAGAEYDDPKPPKSNHFSNVIVFHKTSRSIFVDDTILCLDNPGLVLRLLGFKSGKLYFHPSIKGPGLYHTKEAPLDFQRFIYQLLEEWHFDHICCAHTSNVLENGREKLAELIRSSEPMLKKLSERNANSKAPPKDCGDMDPSSSTPECG